MGKTSRGEGKQVMKVVAINGSARREGNTFILLSVVLDELRSEGVETELIHLDGVIRGCIADLECFRNKDGKCAHDDDLANHCIVKMREADGILLGSPTYISDVSANMKALIERCNMVSRANGDMLQKKVGAAVIAARRAGAIHAFSSINCFFLLGQMIVVGSSHWNVGLGREPGEVRNDAEGMQTMKMLGRNMAWLLKKIHV